MEVLLHTFHHPCHQRLCYYFLISVLMVILLHNNALLAFLPGLRRSHHPLTSRTQHPKFYRWYVKITIQTKYTSSNHTTLWKRMIGFYPPQDWQQRCMWGSFLPLAAPGNDFNKASMLQTTLESTLIKGMTMMITCLRHRARWSVEDVNSQLCFGFPMNILGLAFVSASFIPIQHIDHSYFMNKADLSQDPHLEMGVEKVNSVPVAISSPAFVQTR